MNYFIDCGTHFFEGLKKLNNIYLFDENWIIYCFEPNPITFQKSLEYKPDFVKLQHIKAAVSDHDGNSIINCDHLQDNCGEGSNILPTPPKIDIQYNHIFSYIQYSTITYDLASFIENQITSYDRLVIKLDIEGSEYQVLPKLIQNNIRISDIYIEFHDRFFENRSYYIDLNKRYVSQLEKMGTKVVIWE